jgi:hypothetical protein
MKFSPVLRLELLRLCLSALARVIAFDAEPTHAARSRGQHLRNGVGALLSVSSDVLRRNVFASLWPFLASCGRAVRDPATSDLGYGLSELRRADPWSAGKQFAGRHPLAVLVVTVAGLGLVGQSLGRGRRD